VTLPLGLFLRNWTLKVAAFGVALLLWVAVRAEVPNRQEMPGIPVRVEVSDPGWELVEDPTPSTVTVRFGGPSRELLRMAMDRPSLVIPLDGTLSGDTVVLLRNAWVRVQEWPGVIAEDIQPGSVRIALEPVVTLDLPPALRFEGSLPDHLALPTPPVITPALIRVEGARSRLADLDSVRLLPIDLSAVSSSGTVSVGVDTSGFDRVRLQPSSIQVDLRVEDRVERVVSGIPVVLPQDLEADEGFQAMPGTGSVIVRGARSAVERADPTEFQLMVAVPSGQVPGPGEEAQFPVTLVGVPSLLQGESLLGTVTVRNRAELPE